MKELAKVFGATQAITAKAYLVSFTIQDDVLDTQEISAVHCIFCMGRVIFEFHSIARFDDTALSELVAL
jgi:hypothetical protein